MQEFRPRPPRFALIFGGVGNGWRLIDYFRFRSFATEIGHPGHLRLSLKNGNTADIACGPVRARNRLMHRSKWPPYSISSLARASSVGGPSRPSALAVLRLIANSYFVGVCTGRSAGFSDLRIRSQ